MSKPGPDFLAVELTGHELDQIIKALGARIPSDPDGEQLLRLSFRLAEISRNWGRMTPARLRKFRVQEVLS